MHLYARVVVSYPDIVLISAPHFAPEVRINSGKTGT